MNDAVTDVDECATPVNKCRYACKNTVGSFLCVCPDGFTQVGQDECRGEHGSSEHYFSYYYIIKYSKLYFCN